MYNVRKEEAWQPSGVVMRLYNGDTGESLDVCSSLIRSLESEDVPVILEMVYCADGRLMHYKVGDVTDIEYIRETILHTVEWLLLSKGTDIIAFGGTAIAALAAWNQGNHNDTNVNIIPVDKVVYPAGLYAARERYDLMPSAVCKVLGVVDYNKVPPALTVATDQDLSWEEQPDETKALIKLAEVFTYGTT